MRDLPTSNENKSECWVPPLPPPYTYSFLPTRTVMCASRGHGGLFLPSTFCHATSTSYGTGSIDPSFPICYYTWSRRLLLRPSFLFLRSRYKCILPPFFFACFKCRHSAFCFFEIQSAQGKMEELLTLPTVQRIRRRSRNRSRKEVKEPQHQEFGMSFRYFWFLSKEETMDVID